MERWIRTLKEECLYRHDFATLDEARAVISEFIERYNHEWLLERHGDRTLVEVRRALTRMAPKSGRPLVQKPDAVRPTLNNTPSAWRIVFFYDSRDPGLICITTIEPRC